MYYCDECKKEFETIGDCIQHTLNTSKHTNFYAKDGTPINLDFGSLIREGIAHDCFEEGLKRVAEQLHIMPDHITIMCSGMGKAKCPIDGRDVCELDDEKRGQIGYHEFRSNENWHVFTFYANLPLIELLFSKGYPELVKRIKEKAEEEEKRFKEAEKEGKAMKIPYMRLGGSEDSPWNVLAQCRQCKNIQPIDMFIDGNLSEMPDNAIATDFKCQKCGWHGTLNTRDMMGKDEFYEYLLQRLNEKYQLAQMSQSDSPDSTYII